MKYAFVSDIHGNAVALEAVLKDIKEKGADKTFVLGDLCFRGPEPKKSLDLVRSLNTDVIKGNADEWVIRGVQKGEVPDGALEMMNQEREWTAAHLDKRDIDFLKALPHSFQTKIEDTGINGFHATPESLFEIIAPNSDDDKIAEKLMTTDAQVFIYGHIHLPFIRYIKGKTIINTGSVGLPFDGLPKASYAMVEVDSGKMITSIERVEYNLTKTIELFQQSDYPNRDMMIRILKNASIK